MAARKHPPRVMLSPGAAGLRRSASTPNGGLPPSPLPSLRSLGRVNSRSVYGAVNYARSELEEKQILAGYQAVEDLVKMTQASFETCFHILLTALA